MKIVIGATGASGSIYLQRLLEQINNTEHEVHLVMTAHARQVADHELWYHIARGSVPRATAAKKIEHDGRQHFCRRTIVFWGGRN